jgi:hypothetical protein
MAAGGLKVRRSGPREARRALHGAFVVGMN